MRRAHTYTYTIVRYANPYLVCDTCGQRGEGYVNAPGREEHMANWPCEHPAGVTSLCPSWGPVDGCLCLAHLGYVPHDPTPYEPSEVPP